MTMKELKEAIKDIPDDREVVIEVRMKTGYDQGDIYLSQNIGVVQNREQIRLVPQRCQLAGGW